MGPRHGAPRCIRWAAYAPATCLLVWLGLCFAVTFLLVATTTLSIDAPHVGWRIKQDDTAEALDAYILAATDAAYNHRDQISPLLDALQPSLEAFPGTCGHTCYVA